jgi:hypothetical protein
VIVGEIKPVTQIFVLGEESSKKRRSILAAIARRFYIRSGTGKFSHNSNVTIAGCAITLWSMFFSWIIL